ncbi:hypothetical protein F0332_016115 [Klebsiella grimontii]|uniref:hypothetical protein n=1 Tax=Klebsiella TaxID=570 RepID=UPI000BEF7B42|nr:MULTISPECIES: hypothetical protein [Klebsiella]KAA0492799.1 hypothetical protein F0332_11260 [Klebsiella grimontii]PEN24384.1 hypothetical protein CMQ96_11335 [Klebsiella sp. MBT K-1]RRZ69809.1 hypothetical protein EGK39_25265 [Klebsiella oxytoca]
MKEHGMIFNGEMARAILDGRKTQTRRIIKNQRQGESWSVQSAKNPLVLKHTHDWWLANATKPYSALICPFGAVGDRIWVRETWATLGNEDGCYVDWEDNLCKGDERSAARIYRASCEQRPGDYGLWSIPDDAYWKPHTKDHKFEGAWRPSIHMPRWASRITLEITCVRVERLNAISEHDAQAEGVAKLRGGFWQHYQPGWTQHQLSARGSFVTLWKSIYGEESWNSNPWVWVIEFKRIEERAA